MEKLGIWPVDTWLTCLYFHIPYSLAYASMYSNFENIYPLDHSTCRMEYEVNAKDFQNVSSACVVTFPSVSLNSQSDLDRSLAPAISPSQLLYSFIRSYRIWSIRSTVVFLRNKRCRNIVVIINERKNLVVNNDSVSIFCKWSSSPNKSIASTEGKVTRIESVEIQISVKSHCILDEISFHSATELITDSVSDARWKMAHE